jgi:transposase
MTWADRRRELRQPVGCMHATTNEIEVKRERAAVETAVTMKLAMDVHAGQITSCRQVDGRLPQPPQRLSWGRTVELVQWHLARGEKVFTCYEAGPCGYGLHRQLVALGATNYVVAPQCWDERRRRVKTDRRDARELCQRLDRYVRGNTDAFTVVRVPTVEEESRRALCRHRGALLKERQRCELRGHGLMLSQGVAAPRQWWQEAQWPEVAPQLPPWLRPEVERWRAHALRLQAEVDEVTPQIEALSGGHCAPKGLGALTHALLLSEIFDWSRFHNRRQPGSFTGLCPSEDSSDRRRRQGSVTKHGNPRVRHLLVEAIWRLLALQPDYPPVKKLRAATGKRGRKRLAVAAARRLAVDLWRIYTGRQTAEQLKLIMVKL